MGLISERERTNTMNETNKHINDKEKFIEV